MTDHKVSQYFYSIGSLEDRQMELTEMRKKLKKAQDKDRRRREEAARNELEKRRERYLFDKVV